MTRVRQADLIRSVSDRWDKQYPSDSDSDKLDTGELLRMLPLSATTAMVAAIIGNDTWTRAECDECERTISAYVCLGKGIYCESCIRLAWKMAEGISA